MYKLLIFLMSLLMHWLHLLATIAWIGGLTFIVFVAQPVVVGLDPTVRATIGPRMAKRFLTLVWIAIAVLLVTGLYRVLLVQQMFTADRWFQTGYGHLLMTKLVLFFLFVGIAGHLTAVTYPRLRAHAREHLVHPGVTACTTCTLLMRKAKRIMRIGWGLAAVIVLLAAKLRGP